MSPLLNNLTTEQYQTIKIASYALDEEFDFLFINYSTTPDGYIFATPCSSKGFIGEGGFHRQVGVMVANAKKTLEGGKIIVVVDEYNSRGKLTMYRVPTPV